MHDKIKREIPLIRKEGHIYYNRAIEVLLTMGKLRRIHRVFYHPAINTLYSLIKRAQPKDATSGTMRMIEVISVHFSTCQYHYPRPLRFSATITGVIVVNDRVILDLMWRQKRPILHVVDADTRYSTARFLDGESTEDVWETFLLWCISTYIGYPGIVKIDPGSVSHIPEWNKLTDNMIVAIKITPIEM